MWQRICIWDVWRFAVFSDSIYRHHEKASLHGRTGALHSAQWHLDRSTLTLLGTDIVGWKVGMKHHEQAVKCQTNPLRMVLLYPDPLEPATP